jgi:hypothetical protein
LKLGEAFDVTADKKQTDFKRRDTVSPWSYVHESAYEIVLRNAKKEAVTVVVREPLPGDWTMLQETERHSEGRCRHGGVESASPARGQRHAALPRGRARYLAPVRFHPTCRPGPVRQRPSHLPNCQA